MLFSLNPGRAGAWVGAKDLHKGSHFLELLDSSATVLLGETADGLRRSGEAGQRAAESGGEVFARLGTPREAGAATGPELSAPELEPAQPADELDRLFTDGDRDVR